MAKPASEESVSAKDLKNIEDIAEGLPQTTTPATTDSATEDKSTTKLDALLSLKDSNPNLVQDKYWDPIIDRMIGKHSTHEAAAKVAGVNRSSFQRQFKKVEKALEGFEFQDEPEAVEELPTISAERVLELKRKAKQIQMDPYSLLPGEGQPGYKEARRYQSRRAERSVKTADMADSIIEHNIYENPTVQASCSENGHRRVCLDGLGRLAAWLLADAKLGGTAKKPVLEFPMCDEIPCTNAEAAFLSHVLNVGRDDYDQADVDYSIVRMHEQYPQTYTVTALAKLFKKNKSTISKTIDAWQNSWPSEDPKKRKRPSKEAWENPIRKALEERRITTYHARALASLKKWPTVQMQKGKWLLDEVGKYKRKDAYIEQISISQGGDRIVLTDHGISAGHLLKQCRQAATNQKSIEHNAKVLAERVKKGTLTEKLPEAQFEQVYKQLEKQIPSDLKNDRGELGKGTFRSALSKAKIKIVKPEPVEGAKTDTGKTTSPAREHEDADAKPIPPCENCQLCYNDDIDGIWCVVSEAPDEDNQCGFQIQGRPMYQKAQCLKCNGITVQKFLKVLDLGVGTHPDEEGDIAHDVCQAEDFLQDIFDRGVKLIGKCESCMNFDCMLLSEGHIDLPEGLDIHVKECPSFPDQRWDSHKWYIPVPKVDIKKVNKAMDELVERYKKLAVETNPEAALQTILGDSAGRNA